jgi:IclR family transcriptional regulator, acetate operon repressor
MDSAQTVSKALDALAFMASAHGPLSVRAIASGAEVSTGSAYRILNALEGRGAIRRLPDGRVVLGDFLVQVASAVDYYPRLRMAAAGPMMDLRMECGMETIGLYVRLNSAEMTCIEALPGLHSVSHVEKLYEPVPISRGAVSLVFLSIDAERYGPAAVRTYLQNLPTHVRPDDIDRVLDRAARMEEEGVAPSMGTRIPDAASIACPIPAAQGYPTAVLSVSGTVQRFSEQPTRQWAEHLKQAAARIAETLAEQPAA